MGVQETAGGSGERRYCLSDRSAKAGSRAGRIIQKLRPYLRSGHKGATGLAEKGFGITSVFSLTEDGPGPRFWVSWSWRWWLKDLIFELKGWGRGREARTP